MHHPLALQRHGAGGSASAPLVLVHGFLCSGSLFSPNIPVLQQARQIITVDLPGFGASAHLPAANNIAEMSAQVADTLHAANITRYHLLGHSMGGMVALQLALSNAAQVQSLVVYASNSSGDLPDRFESFAASKQKLQQDFAATKNRICATWLKDGVQHPHFHLLADSAAVVSLETAENAIDAMAAFDVDAQLGELQLPTLLLSAAEDRTYTARCQRELAAKLPQARTAMMHGCAHCAHLEDEATFNRILGDWLGAQDAA